MSLEALEMLRTFPHIEVVMLSLLLLSSGFVFCIFKKERHIVLLLTVCSSLFKAFFTAVLCSYFLCLYTAFLGVETESCKKYLCVCASSLCTHGTAHAHRFCSVVSIQQPFYLFRG